MRNIFYRLYGKTQNNSARMTYGGMIIKAEDVKRLVSSSLKNLDSKFIGQVRCGARFLDEVFSFLPEGSSVGIDDEEMKDYFEKILMSELSPDDFLIMIEPVYSALKNHNC